MRSTSSGDGDAPGGLAPCMVLDVTDMAVSSPSDLEIVDEDADLARSDPHGLADREVELREPIAIQVDLQRLAVLALEPDPHRGAHRVDAHDARADARAVHVL